MNILHVSCSPRGPAAESYRLSQKIIGFLLRNQPTATVTERNVSGGVLAHIDEDYAMSQHGTADVSQEGTAAQSEQLIRELQSADVVVIATPMNNYTLPSSLKLWIDHVVRVRWTFNVSREGKVGLLRDRPVFVAVSSAGRYSGANARQPDFLTPYLRAILGMIGLHDLTFISVQGAALGALALAEARANADQALLEYFSAVQTDPGSSPWSTPLRSPA
jgi:FMN-dependent NADH-azoreductase